MNATIPRQLSLVAVAATLGAAVLMTACGPGDVVAPAASPAQPDGPVRSNPLGGSRSTLEKTEGVTPHQTASRWCTIMREGTDLDAFAATHGLTLQASRELGRGDLLALFFGPAAMQVFPQDFSVVNSQRDDEVILSSPVDITIGFFQGDWGGDELKGQAALAEMRLPQAHATSRGAGITVAILDTGADLDHPFLQGRTVELPPGSQLSSRESANGQDDDEDGLVDEGYGHGTHVAGIIGLCAPDATLLPIAVLDDEGMGTAFTLAQGLDIADEMDVDVVNLSLVLTGESAVVQEVLGELAARGVAVVCAAGNDPATQYFPATSAHTTSVGATEVGGLLAPFSPYGVDIGAAGVGIESSYPGGGSAIGSGTSMACAVMTGATALLASAVPGLTPGKAAEAVMTGGAPIVPAAASDWGRVAPLRALKETLSPPPDPTVLQPRWSGANDDGGRTRG